MKKIALIIIIFPYLLMSQKETENKKNDINFHEIKFNFSYLFFEKRINLIYEKPLKTDTSLGISMLYSPKTSTFYINPKDDVLSFNVKEYNFHSLFFARKYFGKSKNHDGFYIEGNVGYSFIEFYEAESDFIKELKQEHGFSIGGTLGSKIINNENFLFEAMLGVGFNTSTNIYPRLGILIGKRL